MSFFQKKQKNETLNSAEYESCAKKLVELSARIEELENKFKILTTNYDNLRGNFNRKLKGLKAEEESEETQGINNPVILPYNGTFK